jgi:arylsulfatase A-like enzyme
VLCVTAACTGRSQEDAETRRAHRLSLRGQNVIWISIDSVRADHCSFNGYARGTTPNLDALATRSINFSNCVAQAPWTLPSYSSMLSSRYVSELALRHRESKWGNAKVASTAPGLEQGNVLLSEVLRANGYRTAAFVRSWLSAGFGFDQGWDHYAFASEPLSKQIVRALEWIGDGRTSPFFVFLYSTEAHYPFMREHETTGRFGRYGSNFNFDLKSILAVRNGELQLSPADVENAKALYDEGLYHTDADLKPLFDHLAATGLDQETIVVFNSDHGEEFLEHGVISHGQTYFEGVVKTPLLIAVPGLPTPGVTVDQLVENVDVVPTIVDLLQVSADSPFSGRSLRLLLEAPDSRWSDARQAFCEGAWTNAVGMVAREDRKFIFESPARRTLFDPSRDPGERTDLLPQERRVARDLEDALLAHLGRGRAEEIGDAAPVAYQTWFDLVMREHQLARDAETLEELRALGYVE